MDKGHILEMLASLLNISTSQLSAIPEDTDLSELGLDSFTMIQLIVNIESEYHIEFLDNDLLLSNFTTLHALFSTMSKYMSNDKKTYKVLICCFDSIINDACASEKHGDMSAFIQGLYTELLHLYENGVLLCACSSNPGIDTSNLFDAIDPRFLQNHFIIQKSGCNCKTDAILEIAKELNLSLDCFVLLDSNAMELSNTFPSLSELTTVELSSRDDYLQALRKLFANNVLSDQPNRTELYKHQIEREKEHQKYKNIKDYNESLSTNIICCRACEKDSGRIAELSQRTNQFNLSGNRYTEDDVLKLISNPLYIVLRLSANDRFGDLGLVAAAIIRTTDSAAIIEAFYLSCRAFCRGFEVELLRTIKAETFGKTLYGKYTKTNRNERYALFYSDNGVLLYDFK